MKTPKLWCVVVATGLATGGYRVACGEAPVGGVIVGGEMAAQNEAANDAPSPTPTPPVINRTGPEPPLAVAPLDAEKAKQYQEAWAAHLGLPVKWRNSIGMEFTLIPAGEFLMGSPDSDIGAYSDEKPQRQVRITRESHRSAGPL